jgi:hypothetical protein
MFPRRRSGEIEFKNRCAMRYHDVNPSLLGAPAFTD